MNEIFGYCGWDFGGALNNKFHRGENVRIGRNIYRVVLRIGSWHLLKKSKKHLTNRRYGAILKPSNEGSEHYE